MKRTFMLMLACSALLIAPAALAQTSAGSTGGATGANWGASRPAASSGNVLVDLDRIPNFEQRRGPGQTPRALMQTSLLNNFSAYGFTAVRDFRKVGDNYMADAQAPDGRWITVALDPDSGTISTVR